MPDTGTDNPSKDNPEKCVPNELGIHATALCLCLSQKRSGDNTQGDQDSIKVNVKGLVEERDGNVKTIG
jgi:uncharacterized OsmC-like protein